VSPGGIIAYSILSVAQAGLVGGSRLAMPRLVSRWRSPLFALLPVGLLIGVTVAIHVLPGTAHSLALLAFAGVPLLAVVAALIAGVAIRLRLIACAAVSVALALATVSYGLPGQFAALTLTAASCVPLAALLVAATPPRWLRIGVLAMAAADLVLVASGYLGPASSVLNAAIPSVGLPRLQRAQIGPVTFGYGDLFLAALLGAMLTAERRRTLPAALATALFALAAGSLFAIVPVLPATLPVAAGLAVAERGRVLAFLRGRAPSARGAP
jgi:hypothetical protein